MSQLVAAVLPAVAAAVHTTASEHAPVHCTQLYCVPASTLLLVPVAVVHSLRAACAAIVVGFLLTTSCPV
jgi:hypothetical protein